MEIAMQKPSSLRDLQCVDTADWPQRAFPNAAGRVTNQIPVVIKQSLLNSVHLHGQQHPEVEICGVLIGRGYRDEDGPYVYIEGAIRGDHADNQVAQVTFTGETWNHIYSILDKAWPECRILGWYHTHPGFGIFLSGMDLFIHNNFFGGSEQFALVYDPLSGDEGVFLWHAGEPVKGQFLVEPDAEEEPPQRPRRNTSATATANSVITFRDETQDLQMQITRLRGRQGLLMASLAFLSLWSLVATGMLLLQMNRGKAAEESTESTDWPLVMPLNRNSHRAPMEVDDNSPFPSQHKSSPKDRFPHEVPHRNQSNYPPKNQVFTPSELMEERRESSSQEDSADRANALAPLKEGKQPSNETTTHSQSKDNSSLDNKISPMPSLKQGQPADSGKTDAPEPSKPGESLREEFDADRVGPSATAKKNEPSTSETKPPEITPPLTKQEQDD